jgi:50S ribosomal protein L16 3-hydroxylase
VRRTKKKLTSVPNRDGPGLEALFGRGSLPDFLETNWPGKPRVYHHQGANAPELWRMPDLQSLAQALTIALPETIFANLPDRDEEYSQINLPKADDVQKAFACKMGISMEPDLSKIAELVPWLRGIQRDLGFTQETFGRCNIYAIPNGGRTACHYDQNINFVCQISGEKTWHLAPNTHVINPMTRFTIGTPPDRPTVAYSKKELPLKMPEAGRISVVLKPGSVLFVPRGFWHQTTSKGDSLALNFTYDQLSWAQVAANAICHRLMRDEKWRGVAYGLRGEGAFSERAAAEFQALLQESGELLGEVEFEELG